MKKDAIVWYKHIMYDGEKRIGFRDFKTFDEAVTDAEYQKQNYNNLVSSFEMVTTVRSLDIDVYTPLTIDGKVITAKQAAND